MLQDRQVARGCPQFRHRSIFARFRNWGIIVIGGSQNTRIENLAFSTNCGAGIRVTVSAFDTLVQGNTVVAGGATPPGFTCGGI